MSTAKRHILSVGKGYLSAAGPQARFITFLLAVLICYTFLLFVVRKLAEILQLPLFFPLSLGVLMVFIGVAGTIYSHKFIGPLARLRKAVDQLADGNTDVALQVRDADDPILQELSRALGRLAENQRHTRAGFRDAVKECEAAAESLRQAAARGADTGEIDELAGGLRDRLQRIEHALHPPQRSPSEVNHG